MPKKKSGKPVEKLADAVIKYWEACGVDIGDYDKEFIHEVARKAVEMMGREECHAFLKDEKARIEKWIEQEMSKKGSLQKKKKVLTKEEKKKLADEAKKDMKKLKPHLK